MQYVRQMGAWFYGNCLSITITKFSNLYVDAEVCGEKLKVSRVLDAPVAHPPSLLGKFAANYIHSPAKGHEATR